MRRYSFYIFIAVLTFVTGYLIALKIYQNSQASLYKIPKSLISDKSLKQSDIKSEIQNPAESFPLQETQKEPSKPFCRDREILRVWKYLVKDRDFQTWEPISDESLDCTDMLEIKKIDLNRDGKKEILLLGKNFNLCSAVGNCAFWILQKNRKTYKKLLYSTEYIDISGLGEQVRKNKTKGYFDILLKGHYSASETTYESYKFDGRKYQQSKCLVNVPIAGTSDNPQWKFVACQEFFKP